MRTEVHVLGRSTWPALQAEAVSTSLEGRGETVAPALASHRQTSLDNGLRRCEHVLGWSRGSPRPRVRRGVAALDRPAVGSGGEARRTSAADQERTAALGSSAGALQLRDHDARTAAERV